MRIARLLNRPLPPWSESSPPPAHLRRPLLFRRAAVASAMISRAVSGSTLRGLFAYQTKPNASAPASTAVSASCRFVVPANLYPSHEPQSRTPAHKPQFPVASWDRSSLLVPSADLSRSASASKAFNASPGNSAFIRDSPISAEALYPAPRRRTMFVLLSIPLSATEITCRGIASASRRAVFTSTLKVRKSLVFTPTRSEPASSARCNVNLIMGLSQHI